MIFIITISRGKKNLQFQVVCSCGCRAWNQSDFHLLSDHHRRRRLDLVDQGFRGGFHWLWAGLRWAWPDRWSYRRHWSWGWCGRPGRVGGWRWGRCGCRVGWEGCRSRTGRTARLLVGIIEIEMDGKVYFLLRWQYSEYNNVIRSMVDTVGDTVCVPPN